jgi:Uma2 family endonuclease
MAVRQLTYDDYQALLASPEYADRIIELIDGELIEKMPSYIPSRLALRIARYFDAYLDEHPLGGISGEAGGYVLPNGDILIPDVAFVCREKLDPPPQREVLGAPDLAVEVMSPTDSLRKLRQKAERYLANGTALVWLVLPETRTVEVYDAAANDVVVLGESDTLTGGTLLPGLAIAVRDLFDS